jgi:hypothetical protein
MIFKILKDKIFYVISVSVPSPVNDIKFLIINNLGKIFGAVKKIFSPCFKLLKLWKKNTL